MVSFQVFSLDIIVAIVFAFEELQVRHGDKLREETERERFQNNYGIPFFHDAVVAVGCTCDSRFKMASRTYNAMSKVCC